MSGNVHHIFGITHQTFRQLKMCSSVFDLLCLAGCKMTHTSKIVIALCIFATSLPKSLAQPNPRPTDGPDIRECENHEQCEDRDGNPEYPRYGHAECGTVGVAIYIAHLLLFKDVCTSHMFSVPTLDRFDSWNDFSLWRSERQSRISTVP